MFTKKKHAMKQLLIFFAGSIIIYLTMSIINAEKKVIKEVNPLTLTIRTISNSYYIKELTVSNYMDDNVVYCKSERELYDYILEVTKNDNRPGFECLKSKF
jgi:hypothetical protein